MSYTLTFTLTQDSAPVVGADVEIKDYQGSGILDAGVTDSSGIYTSDVLTASLVDLHAPDLVISGLGDGDSASLDVSADGLDEIPDAPADYGAFVDPIANSPFEADLQALLMAFEMSWQATYEMWRIDWLNFISAYNDEDGLTSAHLDIVPETPPTFPTTTLTGYSDLAADYAAEISTWKTAYLNFASSVTAFLTAYDTYFYGTAAADDVDGLDDITPVPANFPGTVWTGTSTTRPAPAIVERQPDYNDWSQLTSELIAAQQELSSLGGMNVGDVADANVVGGVPVLHRIDIADASADTDVILTHKTRITDIRVVKTAVGGASDSVTVKNGTTAITNAMSLNVADKVTVRPTTIDDASYEIAAAGTLRITAVKSTNCACVVYVHGIKVA